MSFINQQGYDVKKGKAAEFQAWLAENEEQLAATCPAGIEYMGTFVDVLTSEKNSGGFRTIWGMDSYGAMDSFSEAMKKGDTFAQLMEALAGFAVDQLDGGNWGNVVSRSATDAAIWGDEA